MAQSDQSVRISRISCAIAIAAFAATVTVAAQQDPSEECLACHADALEITFTNNTTRTIQVQADAIKHSVHAGKATCVDCHPNGRELPHSERQYASSRQLTVAASEQCRQCHFSEYRQSLESVHAEAVARGDSTAPVCVDCHGSHDISKASNPRTRVADMCGTCHTGAATTYASSVHGQDVAKNIADVPTCTDCHGDHKIAGPRQAGWRTSTPDICGDCHADPVRMAKYGLSTNVLKTYVADFHGKTSSLRMKGHAGAEPSVVAVCSDCHGTHGVTRVDDPSSPVLKANLVNTCRSCHTEASVNFPDAWLSHYEPSWEQTPVLQAVKLGYTVLIPFIIGGMMLQMLLHIWRMAVNR
jgi:nitrate/TMAO reductase-like tetraheme cytochrome c subunit